MELLFHFQVFDLSETYLNLCYPGYFLEEGAVSAWVKHWEPSRHLPGPRPTSGVHFIAHGLVLRKAWLLL